MKISISTFVLFMFVSFNSNANKGPTKFYNFDDLLIDGKVKKPQVLYTDARQKVKFERLHRFSVIINILQIFVCIIILIYKIINWFKYD